MKKKVLIAVTIVFALAMAVYALNQTHSFHIGNADCCKKSDACPMKEKPAASSESPTTVAKTDSDKPSCCDDCPMKDKMADSDKMSRDNCPMKGKMADTDKTSRDNCPMKANTADSSPDNCPMKMKQPSKDAPKTD